MVIVCQSNAVAARCEVECKFCLGNSLLCTKKERRGWPRCRIYIYNYSHDTIISHHNSSARDVSSDRGGASHAAYQTAAWQAWHSAPGLVICTVQKSHSLSICVPLILSVRLGLRPSAPLFPRRLSSLVWAKLKMRVLPRSARHSLWHSSRRDAIREAGVVGFVF